MSAIYNSVFGATSNSPPPTLDKRNLSDTSSPIQTKHAKIEGSPLSTSKTKNIAKLLEIMHSRFNSLELEEKLDSQHTRINEYNHLNLN